MKMSQTAAAIPCLEGGALLHLGTEIDAGVEVDFNRWCEEHVHSNLKLPGFLAARRYVKDDVREGLSESPRFLTLYGLESESALQSDAYASHDQSIPEAFTSGLRFWRSVYRSLETHVGASAGSRGKAILHVTVDVEPAYDAEFLPWYSEVHVPAVLSAPGMIGAVRYENVARSTGGAVPEGQHSYCTLYEMEDPGVIGRPEMVEASEKGICPKALEPHRVAINHIYREIFRAPDAG